MKPQYTILLFCLFAIGSYSQDSGRSHDKNKNTQYALLRSTVGVGGGSTHVSTNTGNYIISHSIGQSSVIGTYSKNEYTLRQGYQQPFISAKIISPINESTLNAVLYPNPFRQSVNISFSHPIKNPIQVVLFDIVGKTIRSQKLSASQLVTISLNEISKGVYFLSVSSGTKKCTAKLIKE